jgi:hypothetical protein
MALKASSYYLALCLGLVLQAQDLTKVIWEGQTATSIEVAVAFSDDLRVTRVGTETTIAGKFSGSPPVLFEPYLPFTAGASYEIKNGNTIVDRFTVPTTTLPPRVTQIYPKTDTLPANFLKFYIKFDQPMTSLSPYESIRLEQDGRKIDRAFLETTPPLWNEDRTRLTLWIEPGRIKSDLGPNQKLGAVLQEGQSYQLVISQSLTSAQGQELKSDYVKSFYATAPDTVSPSIDTWRIRLPERNTKDTLVIDTLEPMDQSVFDYFEVIGMPGNIQQMDDRRILFIPDLRWTEDSYTIRVKSISEDLAGNNFNRRFEEDLTKSNSKSPQRVYHERAVLIK